MFGRVAHPSKPCKPFSSVDAICLRPGDQTLLEPENNGIQRNPSDRECPGLQLMVPFLWARPWQLCCSVTTWNLRNVVAPNSCQGTCFVGQPAIPHVQMFNVGGKHMLPWPASPLTGHVCSTFGPGFACACFMRVPFPFGSKGKPKGNRSLPAVPRHTHLPAILVT